MNKRVKETGLFIKVRRDDLRIAVARAATATDKTNLVNSLRGYITVL